MREVEKRGTSSAIVIVPFVVYGFAVAALLLAMVFVPAHSAVPISPANLPEVTDSARGAVPPYTAIEGKVFSDAGWGLLNNAQLPVSPVTPGSYECANLVVDDRGIVEFAEAGACPASGVVMDLTAQHQAFVGGYTVTSQVISTGSFTLDCGLGLLSSYVNNGAFTITAPAADSWCRVMIENGASAGAITFTGFTKSALATAALTIVNGDKFLLDFTRVSGVATVWVTALQ